MDGDLSARENNAIQWAQANVAFDEAIEVRNLPWGRMSLLRKDNSGHWLKQLKGDIEATAKKLGAIADTFADLTPPVVASDPAKGFLLFAHEENQPFPDTGDFGAYASLLKAYAVAQCSAQENEKFLKVLPQFDLVDAIPRLLEFLGSADRTPDGGASAAEFIGRQAAEAYRAAIQRCEVQLRALLKGASALPLTLCHGDLRPGNAGFRPDGSPVLFDWDDAKAGPAGLSLHGVLGGSSQAVRFLLADEEAAAMESGSHHGSIINFYAGALVDGGYASADALHKGLPGAITAGIIDHTLTFGSFPPFHDDSTRESAATIIGHLEELLDICAVLAEFDAQLAGSLAVFFAGTGGLHRAIPLARLAAEHGQNAQEGAEKEMDRLGPERAARARDALDLAADINQLWDEAELPNSVPRVVFEDADQNDPEFFGAKQDLAFNLFQQHGAVMVENAFPTHMIEKCREQFLGKYADYFVERDHEDALRVGDKRYIVTVDVEGAFNSAAIYMSPIMQPLLKRTLGEDLIVGSFNVITSLPGSKDQGIHQDHPLLFPDAPGLTTPDFAVNMIAPLIPLDDHVGTTCIVKGSQFMPKHIAEQMPRQVPEVPVGAALLLSYRVTHFGLGNRSTQVRPILSINYHRSWFRDQVNHEKQIPVSISPEELVRVKPDLQPLFSWMRSDP